MKFDYNHTEVYFYIFKDLVVILCTPFMTLCLGSIGMDHVISVCVIKGQFYKGNS